MGIQNRHAEAFSDQHFEAGALRLFPVGQQCDHTAQAQARQVVGQVVGPDRPLDNAVVCRVLDFVTLGAHPTMHGVAKWFHPAVYHAAAAAGFNSLPLLSRELGLISFEKRYLEQVRKVWMGEQLGPVPVAELAGPAPERTPEVGNQALAQLRALRSRGAARA